MVLPWKYSTKAKIIMMTATKDQAILADKLGLSDKQLSYVTNSEPGSGLILFDNVVIPFVDKYPTDTKTYRIMNTKPEESVQKEGAV